MTTPPSASGLDTNQLVLMRMMLSQQQRQPFKLEPVQDIGSGISQGVGHILDAVMQRRQQRAEQAYYSNMLAQTQQAESAAQQQQVLRLQNDFPGHDQGWYQNHAGIADSTYNNMLDTQGKQDTINRTASTLQGLPQFRSVVPTGNNLVSAPGSTALGNPYAAGPSTLPLPLAQAIATSPEALAQLVQGYTKPLAVGQTNQMTGPLNVNTPAGAAQFQQVNGFAPPNSYSTYKQAADAGTAGLQYGLLKHQLPALSVQPALANVKTGTDIQGNTLNNQHQAMVNNSTPALLQNQVTGDGIANNTAQMGYDNKQQAMNLLQAGINDGSLFTADKGPAMWAQIQAMGGPDFMQSVPSVVTQIQNGNKPSNKPLGGMMKGYNQTLPSSQPAPSVSPQASAGLSVPPGPQLTNPLYNPQATQPFDNAMGGLGSFLLNHLPSAPSNYGQAMPYYGAP